MRVQVTRQVFMDRFVDLLGGVNNRAPDEYIDLSELSDARNYVPALTSEGILVKRSGLTAVSTTQSASITSIFDGIHDIWATLPTKIITGAGVDQGVILTSSLNPDWTRFNSQRFDIVCNGTEVKKFNGSVWSDLGGSPPAGKYIETYNNMIFLAGHDRGKLRWSNLGDAETWQAVHERNFNFDITGLATFRDVLVVFTTERLYHIRGFGPKELTVSFSTIADCTSHQSIVTSEHGLFWWGSKGLNWSPDGFQVFIISDLKIPKTIDGLAKDQYHAVHGIYNPSEQRVEMYVASSGADSPNLGIYYYPRIGVKNVDGIPVGSFWLQDGLGAKVSASAVVTVSGGKRVYVGTYGSSTKVYEQSGTSDDGTAISAFMETKRHGTEAGLFSRKRLRRIIPRFFQDIEGVVSYGIYVDDDLQVRKSWTLTLEGVGGFLLDTDSLDVDLIGLRGSNADFKIGYSQKFYKIKHRIEDSGVGQNGVKGIEAAGWVLNV